MVQWSMVQRAIELGQRGIQWAAKAPSNIAASPSFILGIDLLQPLYEVLFQAIHSITVFFWGLDSILIYIAYMLHNLRAFMVMHIFSPLLAAFVGEGGSLVGMIRGSFLVAVMLLGLTYIARTFFQFNIVDPQKLFLWGGIAVIFVGTGAAVSLYQGVEAVRDGMSSYLYETIIDFQSLNPGDLSQAFRAPGDQPPRPYGRTERGGIAPLVGYPDPQADIRGYSVAGAFIRASMEDVLNPMSAPLPWQYENIDPGTSFRTVYWNGMEPGELSRLEDAQRGPMVGSVTEGLVRMILGIIPGILAILEAAVMLFLTVATGVIFITFPVAFVFAFFEPLSPMATGMMKQYINIFMKTMVINVLFALLLLIIMAAASMGNPTVLVAGTILGIFFGINFAKDGLTSIVGAANAFTMGLADAVGMKTPMAPGSSLMGFLSRSGQKAARSLAAAGARGALGWMATGSLPYGVGAMLGANRAAYTLASMGEVAGLFGRYPSAGMQAFLRGMRSTGRGSAPLSMALQQMYQRRQAARAASAVERYQQAFEQYRQQVLAQRAKYQQTGDPNDEPEIDRQAREWEEWQENPRYDDQGRPIHRVKGRDGQPDRDERIGPPMLPAHLQKLRVEAQLAMDRPFMGGASGRDFAFASPRPPIQELPDVGDLFPSGGLDGGPSQPQPGGRGRPPTGVVGPPGKVLLGHVRTLDPRAARDMLRRNYVLSVGADGQVQAVPMQDASWPAELSAGQLKPADQTDVVSLLQPGFSVAAVQGGKHYLHWQSEPDRGPDLQAAPSQRPVRLVQPASDAPAIPGTEQGRVPAVDLPSPTTRREDCVSLDRDLARVVREAFRSVPPGAPPPHPALNGALDDPSGLAAQIRVQIAPEGKEAYPEWAEALPTHVAEAIADMRRSGLHDDAIAHVVFEGGQVRPRFAEAMWERARHGRPEGRDAHKTELVGRSPEVEREFMATEAMGRLAKFPDANVVRAAWAGVAAGLGPGAAPDPIRCILASSPREDRSTASFSAGVYSVSAALQETASQPREDAVRALERVVGVGADAVYDAVQRHDRDEAISVVQTVEGLTRDLLGAGMDAATLARTVYMPDGSDIRPEFLDAVVSRAQNGASSFMGSPEGARDLKVLIAAGLGMEEEVSGEAIAEAVAQSVTGPASDGGEAAAVAQVLAIPEEAFENAAPAIQAFVAAARKYQLDRDVVWGLVRAAHGHITDSGREELEQRVTETLQKRLDSPEEVARELGMLRLLASSIPERVRAPCALTPTEGGR